MPNYCWNIVKFYGHKTTINRMRRLMYSGENMQFDFNRIIPIPQELNISSMYFSGMDEVMNIIEKCVSKSQLKHSAISQDDFVKANALYLKTSKQASSLIRYDTKMVPSDKDTMLEHALRVFYNDVKFGYEDWYDWCQAHWGTKWNAVPIDGKSIQWRCSDDPNPTIEFLTAWSSPDQVLIALNKRFPSLQIEMWSVDGGGDWYSYKYFKDGKVQEGELDYQKAMQMTWGLPEDEEAE